MKIKTEIEKYKKMLEDEKSKLVAELSTIGRVNPENPGDWQAVPEKMDTLASDPNEVADTIEGYEENTAILKQLEIRFNEVNNALKRIKEGKFGLCEVCDEEIEKARLEANPAAKTCKKHLK